MARRYGHNPDVVGWQLGTEFAAPDFGPTAQTQFHAWLKNKYGAIANLNQKWATAYWSQTYNNFNQIPVRADHENPALLLDWKRFVSDTWKSYAQNQINALRPNIDPRQFITTNTMGWFNGFNEYELHSILDIAAWDDYISTDHYDYLDNGARHDLTRGYKRKNFWVMETEPAFVNWRKTNTPLKKGQVIDMAWQAIGHGANAVEYWQWRSAPNGQEEYHGTLIGADGKPVYMRDIWPSADEVSSVMRDSLQREMFVERYSDVFTGDEHWQSLPTAGGDRYEWSDTSTYVRQPTFFDGMGADPEPVRDITGARVLGLLGDSVTTDHISPAGSISPTTPRAGG